MKLKTITYSLIGLGVLGLCSIPAFTQSTWQMTTTDKPVVDPSITGDEFVPLPTPDPLNNEQLMNNYFLPNYSNAAKDFIKPLKDQTNPKAWLYGEFPRLYTEDPNNKGQNMSISFKKLFINEYIADAIAKKIDNHFNEDSPVVIFDADHKRVAKNYLDDIKDLDLSSVLTDGKDIGCTNEQLLTAIFLNPWLYEEEGDDGTLTAISNVFQNIEEVDLSVNKLTSIPAGTFTKLIENSTATNLRIDLDHNWLSSLDSSQFSNSGTTSTLLNVDDNRIKDKAYNDFFADMTNITAKSSYSDSSQDDCDFFQPIDENSNYFFKTFIDNNFKQKEQWSKILLNGSKEKNLKDKLIQEINTLNLYSSSLTSDKLKIESNDWSGRLTFTVEPSDNKEHNPYIEDVYIHSIAWPFIFYVVIILAGSAFLYNRVSKIVKAKNKAKK